MHKGPTWLSTRSSWISYVAVCHNKQEIARLGHRDVNIAFRGITTCLEWFENLCTTLTCLPGNGLKSMCERRRWFMQEWDEQQRVPSPLQGRCGELLSQSRHLSARMLPSPL
ncbi:hypothetical protein V6N13_084721 [Hibiscus sabdariffa]|uniref:Uncharacterized protein n=1 Tax=Hibiscus sabdariffa TaxID=183260 RepID=A0ABR2T2N8_9ROSI